MSNLSVFSLLLIFAVSCYVPGNTEEAIGKHADDDFLQVSEYILDWNGYNQFHFTTLYLRSFWVFLVRERTFVGYCIFAAAIPTNFLTT